MKPMLFLPQVWMEMKTSELILKWKVNHSTLNRKLLKLKRNSPLVWMGMKTSELISKWKVNPSTLNRKLLKPNKKVMIGLLTESLRKSQSYKPLLLRPTLPSTEKSQNNLLLKPKIKVMIGQPTESLRKSQSYKLLLPRLTQHSMERKTKLLPKLSKSLNLKLFLLQEWMVMKILVSTLKWKVNHTTLNKNQST